MAKEHFFPPSMRHREFWKFVDQLVHEPPHVHDSTTRKVFADWLQDHDDPRHVIARQDRPLVANPRATLEDEQYALHPTHTMLLGSVPWFVQSYDMPVHAHYKYGDVRLGVLLHPERVRVQRGDVEKDTPPRRPMLRWTQVARHGGRVEFNAPVSVKQLHEYISTLPEPIRGQWRVTANTTGWGEPVVAKLARMKAPAGGMIVNNQFQPGGEFLAKPLQRIRATVTKWLKGRKKLAARAVDAALAGPLPGHLPPAMYAAGFDPAQERLTPEQIRSIEDAHAIPDKLRLSNKPKASREDRERFFTALVRARNPVAKLKLDDPDDALAYMLPHLVADSYFYSGVNKAAHDWYGKDIDTLERGAHKILSPLSRHDRRVWMPHGPGQTLLKALIAATSSGQEPVKNVPNAIRMIEAGYAADPRDPFSHIPASQVDRLRAFLATAGPDAIHAGNDPLSWHQWWLAHANGVEPNAAEYRARPAYVVHRPGHPDHQALVAYEATRGKYTTLPGMGRWWNTPLRKAGLPVVDDKGDIQGKAWTQQDSRILKGNLTDLKHIVAHFGGDLHAVRQWLLSEHPRKNFTTVVGHPLNDKDQVLGPDDDVPGMFFLGPKKGAFALNLHQNEDSKHGRFLTADVWWTRTWHRLQGALFHAVTGKAADQAPKPAQRRLMWAAAKVAAKMAGLRSVADLQANLWYMEQHLDRWFGGDAASSGVVDGINKALADRALKLSRPRTLVGGLGARALALQAAGRLLPPGRLMLVLLKAFARVFDPYRIRLARVRPQPHWQKPDGELVPLDPAQTHGEWAQKNEGTTAEHLLSLGWNRIVSDGRQMYVERSKSIPGNVPHKQLRPLIDHAIESGHESLVTDDIKPRTLWTREWEEGPEKLARILPRQTLDAHTAAHWDNVAAAMKAGVHPAEWLHKMPDLGVLADKMADAGDPREHILREHIAAGEDPARAARLKALTIARGGTHTPEWAAWWRPEETRRRLGVRSGPFVHHTMSDGSRLSWNRILGPGGRNVAYHVGWTPGGKSMMGMFNAAFTRREFYDWLRRLDPDERAHLMKARRVQLSRLRWLIDRHKDKPDGLRQLATKSRGPLQGLLHHLANRLELGDHPDDVERGVEQWRRRRGYGMEQIRLARPPETPVPAALPTPERDAGTRPKGSSANRARLVGKWWIKEPTHSGSPYAEEAAAHVLHTIGVPHIPVRRAEKDGRQFVYAPAADVKPGVVSPDLAHVARTTFGDWLVNAYDRHAENYAHHPEHGHVGIDYGAAFHPDTAAWTDHRHEKPEDRTQSTTYSEYAPGDGDLPDLLPKAGHKWQALNDTEVDPAIIRRALENEKTLLTHTHHATEDLPEKSRQEALAGMKRRLSALRAHLLAHGRVRVGDLGRM